MTTKEAYKLQSHKFHGNKPGKIKLDKMRKRREQKDLMENMQVADTPLRTATELRSTQKKTGKAYVSLQHRV